MNIVLCRSHPGIVNSTSSEYFKSNIHMYHLPCHSSEDSVYHGTHYYVFKCSIFTAEVEGLKMELKQTKNIMGNMKRG